MKRKKIRRSSKRPIAKIQRELWELCKQNIRKKYGNECYTCGKKGLSGSNWQTGHMIPKSTCGAYLKYDLRNLRPQFYHCNINLGGNGAIFAKNMIVREGQEYVDSIFMDRMIIIKALDYYTMLIEKYKLILEELT